MKPPKAPDFMRITVLIENTKENRSKALEVAMFAEARMAQCEGYRLAKVNFEWAGMIVSAGTPPPFPNKRLDEQPAKAKRKAKKQ